MVLATATDLSPCASNQLVMDAAGVSPGSTHRTPRRPPDSPQTVPVAATINACTLDLHPVIAP
jgi:hypothetical protein